MSYIGTAYHGWQQQADLPTVQETVQDAVFKVTGERVHVSGCGRTDAGVHARVYVANAHLETGIPLAKLPLALNARLPRDIAVREVREVEDGFDARFSCRRKEYTYTVYNSRLRDPFYTDRACFFPYRLDDAAIEAAAKQFEGTHDFKSVQSAGSPVKTTVRTVYYCTPKRQGDIITVRICGNGFLYNMVRAITGTLLYAGLHKIEPEDIASILESADRSLSGPTLPAAGLSMTALQYDAFSLTAD